MKISQRSGPKNVTHSTFDQLVDDIAAATGIGIHGDPAELAAILGIGVDGEVAWLVDKPVPQLDTALAAVAGAYEWVTVEDLAVALARTRVGARARVHHLSPTVPALLAWLPTLPGWTVQQHAGVWRAVPVGPLPPLSARDTAVVDALRVGSSTRGDLLASLTGIGYGASTALVHLNCSPLLLRVRDARPLTGRLRR